MIDQDTLKSIEDLHRLKTEGVITDEEFERSKERLLFGNKPAAAAKHGAAAAVAQPADRQPGELPANNDFFGWVTLPLRRYADFTGRSGRKEFWMFQILHAGIGLIGFSAVVSEDRYGDPVAGSTAVFGAALFALLGLLVPLIAVQVRRFHDQDRSGWFAALNLIPYIGVVIVYVMMLLEGTEGENRFGPDPRQA